MASDRDNLRHLLRSHVADHDDAVAAADALYALGWRPPARAIREQAELDALPVGSIVSDNVAAGCTRVHPDPLFGWVRATSAVPGGQHCHAPYLPVTVLWEPQTAEEVRSDGQ